MGGKGGEGKGAMGAWALTFFFSGSSSNLPESNNWTRHVTGAADGSRFPRAAVISGTQVFGCLPAASRWPASLLGGIKGSPTLVAVKREEWAGKSGCHRVLVLELVCDSPPGSGSSLRFWGLRLQTSSGQATDRRVGMG